MTTWPGGASRLPLGPRAGGVGIGRIAGRVVGAHAVRYVVSGASPESVKVVAVPGTVATWTKFVQPDPLQRSILTSVWGVVPFVHFRRIELPVSAVAVRFVGAVGRATAVTTIEAVVVLDAPPLSVTVRDAV